MGRQVNFFMSQSDEADFINFVKKDADVLIFCHRVVSDIPHDISRELQDGFIDDPIVWIGNKSLMTPAFEYIKEQRYFVVDPDGQDVVEFHRSHIDDGRMYSGRLWFATRNDTLNPADDYRKFASWSSKMFRWIRSRSARKIAFYHVMPGADRLFADGIRPIY